MYGASAPAPVVPKPDSSAAAAPPVSVPVPVVPPPPFVPRPPTTLAEAKTVVIETDEHPPVGGPGKGSADNPLPAASTLAAFATTRIGATSLDECACPRCGRFYSPTPGKPLEMFACLGCKHPFLIPGRIPGFHLVEKIGSGEMGEIYRAKDETLGRDVAVKIIRAQYASDDTSRERLRQEARAAARLSHPRVAQIFSLGFSNGQPYVVMELVQGEDMQVMVEREGRIGEHTALRAVLDVAEGLSSMHAAGMVHGDIKPGNIVLDRNGNAKLVDFGLAGMTRKDASGGIVGTPHYIAPELLRGASDSSRSDIYSLGATLYHVLTGQPPFDGKTPLDVAKARLTQPVVPVGVRVQGISRPTQRIVMRMLERDPASRYPDCSELAHDLRLAIKNFDAPAVVSDPAPAAPVQSVTPVMPAAPYFSPAPSATLSSPGTTSLPVHPVLSGTAHISEFEYSGIDEDAASRRRVIMWIILVLITLSSLSVAIWLFLSSREKSRATSVVVQQAYVVATSGVVSPPAVAVSTAAVKTPPPAMVVHTQEAPQPTSSFWSFFSKLGARTEPVPDVPKKEQQDEKTVVMAPTLVLVPPDPAFSRVIAPSWLNGDLEEASVRGSTIWISGTTVVVQGDGFDVANTRNKCRFMHTIVSGAYAFSVRVTDIACTHALARTGIMTRPANQDSGPNLFFGFLGDGSLTMQAHLSPGNTDVDIRTVAASNEWHACHLRLERKDREYRTFYAANGKDWTPFSVYKMDMSEESGVGVVVTSHIPRTFASGRFDKFHLWGLVPVTESNACADASSSTNGVASGR